MLNWKCPSFLYSTETGQLLVSLIRGADIQNISNHWCYFEIMKKKKKKRIMVAKPMQPAKEKRYASS